MRIHKGDTVIVISGAHRGSVGEVLKTFPNDEKVVVRDINIRTRHIKSRVRGAKGESKKVAMPIAVSNVAIYDPKTKKPTRVYYRVAEKQKVRITRKSDTIIPNPTMQKNIKKVAVTSKAKQRKTNKKEK